MGIILCDKRILFKRCDKVETIKRGGPELEINDNKISCCQVS